MIFTGYGERLDVAFSFLAVTWAFSGPASVQEAYASVGNPSDLRKEWQGHVAGQFSSLETSLLCSFHAINQEGEVNRQLSFN